jgi:hypothetical protein
LAPLVFTLLPLTAWQGQAASPVAAKASAATSGSDTASSRQTGDVGAQHRQLAQLAGKWKVTQSLWTPDSPNPRIDTGSATYTLVLGGRHLRQELHIDSAGAPFDALGYIGYDNSSGRYFSTWMDVNFTGLIIAYGDYDPARQTYTFTGTLPGPASGEAGIPMRAQMQVEDTDHFTYDFYERRGGKEALAVRLHYVRKE